MQTAQNPQISTVYLLLQARSWCSRLRTAHFVTCPTGFHLRAFYLFQKKYKKVCGRYPQTCRASISFLHCCCPSLSQRHYNSQSSIRPHTFATVLLQARSWCSRLRTAHFVTCPTGFHHAVTGINLKYHKQGQRSNAAPAISRVLENQNGRGFFEVPHAPFGEVVDYSMGADGTITLFVEGVWIDYGTDCAFTSEIVVQPFACRRRSRISTEPDLLIPENMSS